MADPIVTTTYKSVKVKYTNYGTWNYFASFAVSFGYRSEPTTDTNCRVLRIWFDNVLVYDAIENLGDVNFVFYPGTEDQPFYKGQMVLFFGKVWLADGKGIPAVTAEIVDNTALGSIVGTVAVGRHLTPAWAEFSAEGPGIVQAIADGTRQAWRAIGIKTNTDGGTQYTTDPGIDLTKPVLFAPWINYALAQDGAQKVLVNTARNNAKVAARFGGIAAATAADYQNFPAAVMGIAQNAGKSFSQSSAYFLLASAQDGSGNWPYQVLYVYNGQLVYGAGIGLSWAAEPKCFARGDRAGASIAFTQSLLYGAPPSDATGDVLVAFDYAVRRVRVGVAGSAPLARATYAAASPQPLTPNLTPTIDDAEIYSHVAGVGKIVRLYHYNLYGTLAEADNPIVLLIETNAATHAGFARKIAYDGTILWDSVSINLDSVTDKQLRTIQTSADLTAGKLGVITDGTLAAYSIVDLATGAVETGTYAGATIAAGEPAFWVSSKATFYPLLTDNVFVHVDVPAATAIPLDDAIHSLAIRAGYASGDIIISGLHTTTIQGYIVGSNTTLGDILDNLSTLYQFTYAEIGGQLFVASIFNGEDFISAVTIPSNDLATLQASGADEGISSVIADDANMPNQITVNYIDPDINYQQGTQTAKRSNVPVRTTQSSKPSTLSVPVIAHGDEMLMRLYRALYAVWSSRLAHSIRLPAKYLALIPTDGFTFSALGLDHRVTAVSVTINADFSVSLSVAERNAANRSPVVGTQTPIQPAGRGPVAPIQALLLDLPDTNPAARDDDTLNLGVALSGYSAGHWVAGRLDTATAGVPSSWGTRLNTTTETPVGVIVGIALAKSVYGPFETDYGTKITVALGTIPLASLVAATYAQMLAGANLVAAGKDARYELLQFGNVTDNGDGTVTFDTFFRGLFGTEPVIPMLSVGDYFVPYAGIKSVTYPLADYLAHDAYAYRGVVPGQNPEEAEQNLIIPNANSARMRAPAAIKLLVDTDNNSVELRWRRRARFGGELLDGTPGVPDDGGRTFSLDLFSADMTTLVIRIEKIVMATSDPFDHYVFTTDQLTALAFDPLTSTFMNALVYQVDALRGRGWAGGGRIEAEFIAFDGAVAISGALGAMSGGLVVDIAQALVINGSLGAVSGAGLVETSNDAVLSGALGVLASDIQINDGAPSSDDAILSGGMGAIGGGIVAGNVDTTGLVAHWDMSAMSTSTGQIPDTSGNGHTGYATSYSSGDIAPINGVVTGYAATNSGLHFINCHTSVDYEVTSVTIAALVKPTTNAGGDSHNDVIAGQWFYAGEWGWAITGGTSDYAFPYRTVADGSDQVFVSGTPMASGVVRHVAATYDETTGVMCMYIDGVLSTTQTITPSPLQTPSQEFGIGAWKDGGSWARAFEGLVGDVWFFNRPLSAAEVANLAALAGV
jgi:hypothetical protein